MEYIYILKCQNDKYYIGISKNIEEDYNIHLNGKYCNYTKKNKPFNIDSVFIINNNIIIEDIISKYITMYGSKNLSYKDIYKNNDDITYKKTILKFVLEKYTKMTFYMLFC
jgi:hypothetical protein